MATENKILMNRARASLSNQWGPAIGTNFLYMLISGVGNQLMLIFGGPLELGLSMFSLNVARKKKAELSQLFDGFKYFANSLVTFLLMTLYILLWTLLLIIPGIIAAIAYSQTFFILADKSNTKPSDALKASKEMMDGYKWKYFCLCLRFTGWFLLSILTLGIGLLWLAPYVNVSRAHFYDDLKKA